MKLFWNKAKAVATTRQIRQPPGSNDLPIDIQNPNGLRDQQVHRQITPQSSPNIIFPVPGSLIGMYIDRESIELVEVLGMAHNGVVYRGVEVQPGAAPKTYAVKCLVKPPGTDLPLREKIDREIKLYQLVTGHPGIVALHKVVECHYYIFLIMDYAPNHVLLMQMIRSGHYLWGRALIKGAFLQLLDAVEYCHFLGISHRDLKPENIYCYDDGDRVAITEFALATTEETNEEFGVGSMLYMSPECQHPVFAPQGNYSPMHSDIWSLGIILINLITGRSPWKSATMNDAAFQTYLGNPSSFFPSILPISSEVNTILLGMLDVNYKHRLPLREIRRMVSEVKTFYAGGVIFEGGMACWPWQSGMDIDADFLKFFESEPGLGSSRTLDGVRTLPSKTSVQLHASLASDSVSDSFHSAVGSKNSVVPGPKPLAIGMDTRHLAFNDHDHPSTPQPFTSTKSPITIFVTKTTTATGGKETLATSPPSTRQSSPDVLPYFIHSRPSSSTSSDFPQSNLSYSTHTTAPSPSVPRIQEILTDILRSSTKRSTFLNLRSHEAQLVIDFLDATLIGSEIITPWLRKHMTIALYQLCKTTTLYPKCYILDNISIGTSEGGGAFSDVFKAQQDGEKQVLCVKIVRLHENSDADALFKAYAKEAIIWSQLRHPAILPFYGVYYLGHEHKKVCLVSPWMQNGNLVAYLSKNPGAAPGPLIYDIALGLRYMHSTGLVHGDLKGMNIVINDKGRACITDFGLSFFRADNTISRTAVSTVRGCSYRWAAPELADEELATLASDIWSFGCVCYEALTGQLPFSECKTDFHIMKKLMSGALPASKPIEGLTQTANDLFDVTINCWKTKPADRPTSEMVLEALNSIPGVSRALDEEAQQVMELEQQQFREKTRQGTSTFDLAEVKEILTRVRDV